MREISADAFQFDVSQLEQAFTEVSRYAKGPSNEHRIRSIEHPPR